jgi:hypothetical protein
MPRVVIAEGVGVVMVLDLATELTVDPYGHVFISIPMDLTINCRFDMSRYPFDEHHCGVMFGETR